MTIKESGKVSFKQAFKDYWKGYFDFKGRSTRAGYWWMTLILACVFLLLTAIFAGIAFATLSSNNSNPSMIGITIMLGIIVIFALAIIIPSLALSVRRFRDAGLNNITIILIYVINIVMSFFVSSDGYNFASFITSVLSILIFIITLLPTDLLASVSLIGRNSKK